MYILAISYMVNPTTSHTHAFSIVDGEKKHAFIREWEEHGIKKIKVMYMVNDFDLTSVKVYMRACKRQHGATAWRYKGLKKYRNY